MADSKENLEDAFKVVDRRKFTAEGELRPDAPPEEAAFQPPPASVPPPAAARPAERRKDAGRAAKGVAEPSQEGEASEEFAALLMSLANTAMVYLESRDPIAGSQQNVAAAKQMIGWIEALQRKTEGNLTADEARLVDGLLYELRMQFLSRSKPPKTS